MVARLTTLGRRTLPSLDPVDAWSFALAPVDPRDQGDTLARLGKAVLGQGDLRDLVDIGSLEHASSAQAEEVADRAALLRWFTRRWPDRGGITAADADRMEALAAEAVGRALADEIAQNTYGVCVTCGRPAIPGRPQCDSCWREGRSPRTPARPATAGRPSPRGRRSGVPATVRRHQGRQWKGKLR